MNDLAPGAIVHITAFPRVLAVPVWAVVTELDPDADDGTFTWVRFLCDEGGLVSDSPEATYFDTDVWGLDRNDRYTVPDEAAVPAAVWARLAEYHALLLNGEADHG